MSLNTQFTLNNCEVDILVTNTTAREGGMPIVINLPSGS